MEEAFENEFLSEKIQLEELLSKIEFQLNESLDDFEKVSIDKLHAINDLINDMNQLAIIYNSDFYKDYRKFKSEFNFFVDTYEEEKRFTVEVTLENFLDSLDILKKDLLEE